VGISVGPYGGPRGDGGFDIHRIRNRRNHLPVIDSGLVGSTGGVPREQTMLKGHLPRVTYHDIHRIHNRRNHLPGNSFQFENNYFTEMCSGSEAGSYLRRTDFVYHSTLGLRVIKKKRNSLLQYT